MITQLFSRWLLSIDLSWLIVIAVCVPASAIVVLVKPLRSVFGLFLLSVVGAGLVYRSQIVGYFFVNFVAYVFVAILSRIIENQRWRWSCVAMGLLVVVFLASRCYQLESRTVSLVGFNFLFFALNMWAFLRLITFLWEFGSGRIQRPSLTNFLLWVALPFTLLGPILRYSQFEKQLPSLGVRDKTRPLFSRSFMQRSTLGVLQLLLGIVLTALQTSIVGPVSSLSRLQKILIGFSIAPWSFFLLWAGYFKLMESLAPFWGITLPQSFNRPFGRRNLAEFWSSWNMSATSVFRDYLFFNRWGFQKANVYVNTMIVFLMVGLWHGMNGYWILFGLMHGIGFCAYLWYSRNRSRVALLRQNLVDAQFRYTGPIVTYLYVCSCWFLPPTILKLIR